MSRQSSDEYYVLDLCDLVLGIPGVRQATFDFLRGDPYPANPRGKRLQVDAYYDGLGLVIEYHELQHQKAVSHFDKPNRMTVSGVYRGKQRAIYDSRRLDVLPKNGIDVVVILYSHFSNKGGRLSRKANDVDIIKNMLAHWIESS